METRSISGATAFVVKQDRLQRKVKSLALYLLRLRNIWRHSMGIQMPRAQTVLKRPVRDQVSTHGITLGKHVEWEGGQRETSEEHQHLRDEKRKQSSLQREVRMQAEESRKAGRVCLHGHQEKWHLRDL